MIIGGRRASFLLFVGDLVAFALSLYLTLWLRYFTIPTLVVLEPYRIPFTFLFFLWIAVFYSAGLYSKRIALFPSRLPGELWRTQLANILFAALFFFVIPSFGITPKTILALYFVISFILILIWRLMLYPRLSLKRSRERAVLLSEGEEADELFAEINGNPRYGIVFTDRTIDAPGTLAVIDTMSIDSMTLRALSDSRKQMVDFEALYEEVFDRVPLSKLDRTWFMEHASAGDSVLYLFVKRSIDIVGGLLMALVVIIAAPFIWLANYFEGTKPLFIRQERIGQHGVRIEAFKFRSMTNHLPASGEWVGEGNNRITKVGAFLRKTSLDEFPQCINILKGQLSLIGPRNDILGLGQRLAGALPYYNARYMVKPGITGWAQINQQYEQGHVSPQSIKETQVRLAYDFYYLKHRSLTLDAIIALKTIKRMFFRLSN